jgi:hypothetical protein
MSKAEALTQAFRRSIGVRIKYVGMYSCMHVFMNIKMYGFMDVIIYFLVCNVLFTKKCKKCETCPAECSRIHVGRPQK